MLKDTSHKTADGSGKTPQGKTDQSARIIEKLKLEIAELRESEKTLRENEKRFRWGQEIGKVGSWEWDLIQNTTIWSDQLYRIFGVRPEEFQADAYAAFLNCVHTDDRQRVQKTLENSLTRKTAFDIDYRIAHAGGELKHIHSHGEVICDGSGEPVKLIGISQDVTELRQAEMRLRRTETLGQIGNWGFDIESNRIVWSDEVYQLFGRDPKLGPPSPDEEERYYSKEVFTRLREYAQKVIATGEEVKDYEFPVTKSTGETRYFIGSMFPGKDKAGRVVKLFGTLQDITSRKQAQLEMVRHLEFEKYISGLAPRFVNLPRSKLDGAIADALHWMVDFFAVDRVTLLKLDEEKRELRTINVYLTNEIRRIEVINIDSFPPSIWPALKKGQAFSWSSNREFSDDAAQDLKKLEQLGAGSVVIIPLMVANSLAYVFTIASIKELQTWDKHLIPRIQLFGTLIVSVLQLTEGNEKLARRERSLAEAQRLAHVGDWQMDLYNNEVLWSDELYNILGYGRDDVSASRLAFLDRVHPEDRPLLEKSISTLRTDHTPFAVDHRVLLPDGKIKYCHSLGRLRYDEENKPIFLHGIIQDITGRKVTEDALRISESNLSSAQRIAHLGSWEYDILTNEITWSDEVYRIFGLDRRSFRVRYDSFLELVHPDDRSQMLQAVDLALKNPDNTPDLQFRIIRRDGVERIVQARGEVRFGGNGQPVSVIGTIHDLTELKTIEAETRRLRNELAHLNRVNTVGNMASAIAHEINQPLAAILSNAQAALRLLNFDPPDLNEVREALSDIVAADKRAGEVVRRIRSLVKKEEIRRGPYDINKTIKEVINFVQNEILIQDTALGTELDPGIPVLIGDQIQIQQVILNLIMNALEAVNSLPADKRHIVITARIGGHRDVVVSVADSGPGVEEEYLEDIFEPFFTTKDKGMGMGLSVCASIIENHGGRISVKNSPGSGAQFSFQLPLRREENS